jgi:hypothetical protein
MVDDVHVDRPPPPLDEQLGHEDRLDGGRRRHLPIFPPPVKAARCGHRPLRHQRDGSARTFDHVFSRYTPRDPTTWPRAREMGVTLPPELDEPNAELAPELIMRSLRDIAGHLFPRLAAAGLE